jgi:23S rRNA (guanine1835-N2)-methyltransferase
MKGLHRYPRNPRELLQAWDSADELLLAHALTEDLTSKRVLVLNDSFGALACGLNVDDLTSYTDSYLSAQGTELNSKGIIKPLSRLSELSGNYDHVFARIPKNMTFFEDELTALTHHLTPGATLNFGYMVKHQAKSAFDLIERLVGKTSTSLARKKARLIFARFEKSASSRLAPAHISIDSFSEPFTNYSNVFSREKLDIGTRFFLDHLPTGKFSTILDLGCGNGVLGIAAHRSNPSSSMIFCDESQMAIQSAQENFETHTTGNASYHWTHSCEPVKAESVDLVLCNPPFHQGQAVGDHIARQMFQDAKRVLRKNGVLRVIGNGHLHYPAVLKKIFGNSETVAKNPKFVIAEAVKGV